MKANDAIAATLATSDMVLRAYLGDLSDEELMNSPGPGCQHIAWQLGHLLVSEYDLLESVCPGKAAPLPEGFRETYSKENATCTDRSKFLTKEQYMSMFDQSQQAIRDALASQSESDLDQPSPEHFRNMFPTVGHIFVLLATHELMHAGQWVPVRRALNKPVVI